MRGSVVIISTKTHNGNGSDVLVEYTCSGQGYVSTTGSSIRGSVWVTAPASANDMRSAVKANAAELLTEDCAASGSNGTFATADIDII